MTGAHGSTAAVPVEVQARDRGSPTAPRAVESHLRRNNRFSGVSLYQYVISIMVSRSGIISNEQSPAENSRRDLLQSGAEWHPMVGHFIAVQRSEGSGYRRTRLTCPGLPEWLESRFSPAPPRADDRQGSSQIGQRVFDARRGRTLARGARQAREALQTILIYPDHIQTNGYTRIQGIRWRGGS